MTYNQYISLFRNIATAHNLVNNFGVGPIHEYLDSNTDTSKGTGLWLEAENSNISGSVITDKFTLYAMDYVNKDISNRNEVLSDTKRILEDVLALLRNQIYVNDFELSRSTDLNVFYDNKFANEACGWYCVISLKNDFVYDSCQIPLDGIPISSNSYIADVSGGFSIGVPSSRTLTINNITYDLSANRTWTIATGGSQTLAQTLALGNTTSANNIIVTTNDNIYFGGATKFKQTYDGTILSLVDVATGDGLNIIEGGGVNITGVFSTIDVVNDISITSANEIFFTGTYYNFSGLSGNKLTFVNNSNHLVTTNVTTDTNNLFFPSTYGIDNPIPGDTLNIGASYSSVINIGRAGATVNILGTALYEYAANQYVLDKLITLNYSGAAASGIGVGFEIEENNLITGYFKTNAARSGFDILTPAIAFKSTLSLASLSADRTHTLPNVTGTLATIDGGQTFTSAIWQGTSISTTYTDAKIKGAIAATTGLIPYGNGTADTVTSTANFKYDSANGGLIVGSTALSVSTDIGLFKKDQNAATAFRIQNVTSGTAAQSFLQLGDGVDAFNFGFTNTSFTAAGPITAKTAYLQGTGTGGLVLQATNANGNIQMTSGGTTVRFFLSSTGNTVLGAQAALATNATTGHVYIPTCAGTPTGVPTAYTGKVAMIFDTTNNRLYIYDGGWLGGTTPGAFT